MFESIIAFIAYPSSELFEEVAVPVKGFSKIVDPTRMARPTDLAPSLHISPFLPDICRTG